MTLDRKRLKKGDIFQILTSNGICFGQYLYNEKKMGYVIAIFRDFREEDKVDFEAYVHQEPQFVTIFPLQKAINHGLFALVGNVPVPPHLDKRFIFRATNNFGSDNVLWWFWDGDDSVRIERPLTKEEEKYPRKGIMTAPSLMRRIDSDWRVERDYN